MPASSSISPSSSTDKRRLLRGFQHDRAARGERGCQLPRRGHQRAVPRDDLADDPDRLVTHVAVKIDSGDGWLEHLAVEFGAPAGVVAERLCSMRHFVVTGRAYRLAAVEAFQLGELHDVGFDQLRHAPEEPLTVRRRQTSPATVVEALARRSHGIVQVRFDRPEWKLPMICPLAGSTQGTRVLVARGIHCASTRNGRGLRKENTCKRRDCMQLAIDGCRVAGSGRHVFSQNLQHGIVLVAQPHGDAQAIVADPRRRQAAE